MLSTSPALSNDAIKNTFVEQIVTTRQRTQFQLAAFVVMPEHVHLIVVPRLPEYPISTVLRSLKNHFAQRVIRRWRELNAPVLERIKTDQAQYRFWQHGGGFDRNVRDESELAEKIEYIHANPVKRGLVNQPCEYAWSSARWWSGERGPGIPEMDVI